MMGMKIKGRSNCETHIYECYGGLEGFEEAIMMQKRYPRGSITSNLDRYVLTMMSYFYVEDAIRYEVLAAG